VTVDVERRATNVAASTVTVSMARRKKAVRPMVRPVESAAKHTTTPPSAKQSTTGRHVCDIETEELLTLGNGDNVRAYCHLNVNGKSVHFMLDCGATVNVLPFIDASSVNPGFTALRPAEARLTMFDGQELKILGMMTASVEHPRTGKRRRIEFYVAATHDQSILGMTACVKRWSC